MSNFNRKYNTGALPLQAIPFSKKNKKWKKLTLDALEQIGTVQVNDNVKFEDYYRMVDGKLAFKELEEVMPQYRELAGVRAGVELNSWVKHYDIIGAIINKMVSLYDVNHEGLSVTNLDPLAANEYMQEKENMMREMARAKIDASLKQAFLDSGLNPDTLQQIQDPKEKEAYAAKLQQVQQEATPQSIEKIMSTNWTTESANWAKHTVLKDRGRFFLSGLDSQELTDYLLVGRCFRHYKLGYDNYSIERWHPPTVFFSQTPDTIHIEEGEYVGRIHYVTAHQAVARYGQYMTKKEKVNLLESNSSASGSTSLDLKDMYGKGMTGERTVPFDGYASYEYLKNVQDTTGIPMLDSIDHEGNEFHSFLPELFGGKTGSNNMHQARNILNRNGLRLRDDLMQVTEAYWVSYSLKGFVTYRDEFGVLHQEIVTDELFEEFIKKNKITELKRISLQELTDEPVDNSIMWDYYPEVWQGIKLNVPMGDSLYLNVAPLPYQMKGNSNLFDVVLPVSGMIGQSVGLKLENFQTSYNIVNNQIYNYLEKELGSFFMFDVGFLDASMKDGDTEDALYKMRETIQDVGILPVDFKSNSPKQMIPQSITFTQQIADRIQLSKFYKNAALEVVGMNENTMASPSGVEQDGVKVSQDLYFAQTDVYFDKFEEYRRRSYNIHINVAQYAQRNGKDLSVQYTTPDSQVVMLNVSDENFHLRQLNISFVTSSKKTRDLQRFKNIILQTNTLGNDTLALAEVVASTSMSEVIESARRARVKAQEANIAVQNNGQQIELRKLEVLKEVEEAKLTREDKNKELDRENKLEVERIRMDRASMTGSRNSNGNGDEYRDAQLGLQERRVDSHDSNQKSRLELEQEKLQYAREKDSADQTLRIEELKVKVAAMQNRSKLKDTDARIATINKN